MGLFRRSRSAVGGEVGDGDFVVERHSVPAKKYTPRRRGRHARPTTDEEPGRDGPYDSADVPGMQGRLDLGALWLIGVPGMQLRMEIDHTSGEVTSVTVLHEDSSMQIQAFAAPKSGGIWADIRAEIVESIAAQGGTVREVEGMWGTELRTRLPARGPDGGMLYQPARFIGVDGPRWFLRAVLTGMAAADETQAGGMMDLISSCVVVRGEQAMAPRELLPLHLPDEDQNTLDPDVGLGKPQVEGLSPFVRGPEISEIR